MSGICPLRLVNDVSVTHVASGTFSGEAGEKLLRECGELRGWNRAQQRASVNGTM